MSNDWLRDCQTALDYQFHDPQLLKTALTHSSKKSHPTDSNERLEFLGDAILGFVISERVFKHYPRSTEGDLTKIKSVVVSRRTLADVSRRLGMCDYLRTGKGVGETKTMPISLLADVLEAVIGAMYLDGGMEAARKFIITHLVQEITKVELGQHEVNYKSLLQQYAQRELRATPVYTVVREEGPDHVKQFHVMAVLNGKEYCCAAGRSKKEAEQRAAELTLRALMEASAPEAGKTQAIRETDVGADPDLDAAESAEERSDILPLPPTPNPTLPH